MHDEVNKIQTLSPDEIKSIREMLDAYDKSRWLGGLLFKAALGIGGLITVLATLKSQLLSLIRG
jgi:hypothetical protein